LSNRYRGFSLDDSSNNLIYNNYLDNANNAYDDGANDWNTTKNGTNIIGGPYLGGNYWSDFDEASEGCNDPNSDGICDSNYTLASGNVDYLPLF